ncbi:hypothetical protein GCM10028827_27050 [Mucilaginibacter myungsuensis]
MVFWGCTKKDVAPKVGADFTYIVTDPIPPSRVEFSNHATNATSYKWDFGDNSSSTEKNPQHVYTKAGTYVVTLNATGPDGTGQEKYQLTVGAKAMLIRNISLDQVANAPDIATFFAVVKYDGGGYTLPGYEHSEADRGKRPFAVWGGERFYGVPVQDTLEMNLFYRLPGRPNPVPVGFDNAGVYKMVPAQLTTGNNAHPTDITLQNGSGQQGNSVRLTVSWQ